LYNFKLNDTVHSSLYGFGNVVKETPIHIEVKFENYKGEFLYSTTGKKHTEGYVMLKIVEDRNDFDPENGKYRNWQIEEMDKFYGVNKK
jgi:hypothetical protein